MKCEWCYRQAEAGEYACETCSTRIEANEYKENEWLKQRAGEHQAEESAEFRKQGLIDWKEDLEEDDEAWRGRVVRAPSDA